MLLDAPMANIYLPENVHNNLRLVKLCNYIALSRRNYTLFYNDFIHWIQGRNKSFFNMARLRNPGALAGLLLIIAAFIVVIVFIIPKDERSPGILPENIPGAKELSEIKNKVVGEIKKLTGTDADVAIPNGADAQPDTGSTGTTPASVEEGDEANREQPEKVSADSSAAPSDGTAENGESEQNVAQSSDETKNPKNGDSIDGKSNGDNSDQPKENESRATSEDLKVASGTQEKTETPSADEKNSASLPKENTGDSSETTTDEVSEQTNKNADTVPGTSSVQDSASTTEGEASSGTGGEVKTQSVSGSSGGQPQESA
ncbi:hypothetical protein BdWA1_002152 [Babesia duncani]|uniref:Uncharacterized protein n=1 Tax=Babesia duncani TaxID=323732 RepID=A0AAD9PM37_9APIC|nr:hypothetical protein BdWA1_002152 [Babesia duncani]